MLGTDDDGNLFSLDSFLDIFSENDDGDCDNQAKACTLSHALAAADAGASWRRRAGQLRTPRPS
eukprot:5087867-Pleurochrysis_carterae.AAC.1